MRDFLSIAGIVIFAATAAGTMVMSLLIYLEKRRLPASRETNGHELAAAIADTAAEAARTAHPEKDSFDVTSRKREIYTRVATAMRLLLQPAFTPEQKSLYQNDLLAAYDVAYLWSAELVLVLIREFIEALEKQSVIERKLSEAPPYSPSHAKLAISAKEVEDSVHEIHQRCLLEMRKDAGFPDSHVTYRMISRG
jgi:hypothetical protein